MKRSRSSNAANLYRAGARGLIRRPRARGASAVGMLTALFIAVVFAGATAMAQNGKTLVVERTS